MNRIWKTGGRKPKIGAQVEDGGGKEEIMNFSIDYDTTQKKRRNQEMVWNKVNKMEKDEKHKGQKAKIPEEEQQDDIKPMKQQEKLKSQQSRKTQVQQKQHIKRR